MKMKSISVIGILGLVALACVCSGGGDTSGSIASPTPGAIQVYLSWDNDADLDLELWDSSQNYVDDCYNLSGGTDISNGYSGQEYMEFTGDYSSGDYIMGVGFWAPGPSGQTTVNATVTVNLPDGTTRVFTGSLDDNTQDMWFPCRIDVAAGTVTEMNLTSHRGL